MSRRTRGLRRWWGRCTRFTSRVGRVQHLGPGHSPDRQLQMACGQEIPLNGQLRPRPWHDPGPFRHQTIDVYGRNVWVEYPIEDKRRTYATGGVL